MTPDSCPVCGAEVPERARACPECGADEHTGWSEQARYDDLGVPDDAPFDYADFVQREFGGKKPARKGRALWIGVTILILLAFAFVFFQRAF